MPSSVTKGLAVAALFATLAVLPVLAQAEEAAKDATKAPVQAGKPANLCKELVAFLHPPAAKPPTDTAPAQSTTAVQAPGTGSSAPKPAADGDPQKNSGMSGPTAASGPGAAGPQGNTQNAAAPSGAAAPAPTAAAPAPPPPKAPTAASIAEGDAAASTDDIAGCQRVARDMRRTGVVMPSPLMSLAALDLRFLEAAK